MDILKKKKLMFSIFSFIYLFLKTIYLFNFLKLFIYLRATPTQISNLVQVLH
jgi:hypothetical protein